MKKIFLLLIVVYSSINAFGQATTLTAGRVPFMFSSQRMDDDAGLAWDDSGKILTAQNVRMATVGGGVSIKEGTNATMGAATLSAGTVTVSTTKVTATSRIFLTIQSLGTVSAPKSIGVTARSAGTSFTITSEDITDTSVIAWQIIEPAP